jgi:hypothetical protein
MKSTYLRIGTAALVSLLALSTAASAGVVYSNRVAWASQVTNITTETFDPLAGNVYSTLTLGNVTFSVPGHTDSSALWVSCNGCYTPFGIALVGNHWMTTVQGMFANPVGAVGADVGNLSVNDTIAINVDINGVWYSWNVPYTYPNPFFWGIVAGPGEAIYGITYGPTTSNWVGIDNFSYGAVPEPGTIAMLGTGVLGLAGVLRRKLLL